MYLARLCPTLSTLASASFSGSCADGQIKNRIAMTEIFVNFNETEAFSPQFNVQNFKTKTHSYPIRLQDSLIISIPVNSQSVS